MPAVLPLRPDLVGAQPYGAPHDAGAIRLNVNENPYPPPPMVIEAVGRAVRDAMGRVNRYPDRDFGALRQALVEYLARDSGAIFLEPDNLWAANGSNEVMLHLFQAYGGPGRAALSFSPTYSMYPEYARDTFTQWVTGPRRADFTIDPLVALDLIEQIKPSLIVLASPNNPTGTALPLADIVSIAAATWNQATQTASAVIVIDEAYAEFRHPGQASALTLLPQYPHLAVSRTMSKAFGFAGARLGYLAAAPNLIAALRTVRLPYHLSSLTQAAALAALSQADSLMAQVSELRMTRDRLVEALTSMIDPATNRPLDVAASDANFVLFGTFADRDAIWAGLLKRGVLIRQVGPAGWLRVSVGTPTQTDVFLEALTTTLGEVAL